MGKMAAGTAHHLNTPMASMLLRIQMMREKASGNGMGDELAQLENTVGFCQQFVRRLLDFSRRPAHDRKPEEIAPVVDAVLGFLSPSLNVKRVRVETDLGEGSQRPILADRNQLETLLLILLSNSLDAVSEGGKILIRCRALGPEQLELQIADDGCGIADEHAERIFEPFFTTKPVGKGTGLGLAIARNIVAEHGGTIGLHGAPGGGAVATVRLPLHRSSLQESAS
jgi:two-component system NtrC family sensor kinase